MINLKYTAVINLKYTAVINFKYTAVIKQLIKLSLNSQESKLFEYKTPAFLIYYTPLVN